MVHADTEVGATVDFRKINSHHSQGKQVPLHCDMNSRDYSYDIGQDVRTHIFCLDGHSYRLDQHQVVSALSPDLTAGSACADSYSCVASH